MTLGRWKFAITFLMGWLLLFQAHSTQAAGFKHTLDDCLRELANNVVSYSIRNNVSEVQVKTIETFDKQGRAYEETLLNYIKARIKGELAIGPAKRKEPGTDQVRIGDLGLMISGTVSEVPDPAAPFIIEFELRMGRRIVPSYSYFFKEGKLVKPEEQKVDEGPLKASIGKPDEAAKKLGLNVRHTKEDDPPSGRTTKRAERNAEQIKNPEKVDSDQNILRLKNYPEFGIKIVRDNPNTGRYETVKVEQPLDGQPVVTLHDGDEYEIIVYNDAGYAAAVELMIDGINTMAYSSDYQDLGIWLVDPAEPIQVKGFHKETRGNEFTYYGFLATSLPLENATVKERAKKRKDLGLITATFYPAWRPHETPPKIAFNRLAGSPQTVPGREKQGYGEEVSVQYDRHTPIETLSLRYKLVDVPNLPD